MVYFKNLVCFTGWFSYDITVYNKMNSTEFYHVALEITSFFASLIIKLGKSGQLKWSHLPKMTPIIGRRPASRIHVFYSRNLSHTLAERMVLSGILVKLISKYEETNLTLTDGPQIKIRHYSKAHFKSDISELWEFSQNNSKLIAGENQTGLIKCILL